MGVLVTVIMTGLQAVEALLGASGLNIESAAVTKVINLLVTIVPLVEKEATAVVPYIKNVIAALQANPTTTTAQLAQLATLDAQADAAFEAAATAADAADAAAAAKPPASS